MSELEAVVARDPLRERFRAEVEASAYFLVAEALTNVMKHAHAARAEVTAEAEDGVLQVEVRDDGVGGADPSGHGLVGMADGGGTDLLADLIPEDLALGCHDRFRMKLHAFHVQFAMTQSHYCAIRC